MTTIQIQHVITLCHKLYSCTIQQAPVMPQPSPAPSFLSSFTSGNLWGITQTTIDFLVGLLSVYIIKLKWQQNTKSDRQALELIKTIGEKEKENERLRFKINNPHSRKHILSPGFPVIISKGKIDKSGITRS